jgi:hypothetical protein
MKFVLIVGDEDQIIGPFDEANDAISYAVNVLNSLHFAVKTVEYPMSYANHLLLQRITA